MRTRVHCGTLRKTRVPSVFFMASTLSISSMAHLTTSSQRRDPCCVRFVQVVGEQRTPSGLDLDYATAVQEHESVHVLVQGRIVVLGTQVPHSVL
jgi:hypothetical protein